MPSAAARPPVLVTDAERAVADLLPIEAEPAAARRALRRVPLWFHTFALNRAHDIYTPGVARDHRYRIPFLPPSFAGARVLDVGTFDGFYAFLAEHRGAAEVLAVDNEQYVAWVRARWGIELRGGEGFATIAELLGSRVTYRRGDALAVDGAGEPFDVILCFGILHRIENPLGMLRRLAALLAPGGRLLIETYGIASEDNIDATMVEVHEPGAVYDGDEYVYWGFGAGGLRAMARVAGFTEAHVDCTVVVDGHPRIMATLARAS
jgi:tRNA (mo5U34)-methyltransferase